MSSESKGVRGVPPRWLNCPRKAIRLIQDKFLAFKTPLSSSYDSQVSEECRFTLDMLFDYLKSQKLKMGLWIDLTNTSRFYNKESIEDYNCKYVKLQCRGHGETPSEEQTRAFVQLCSNFIAHNPLEIIGVHCTHGFNRTGFLIISYLVEVDDTSVDAGLVEFAAARPPGIYKGDYIKELYKRYDDEENAPRPPVRPGWCLEYDDANVPDLDEGPSTENESCDEEKSSKRKRRENSFNRNPVFMAGVPGVTPILEKKKLFGIQRRVQEICGWKDSGFPGSQPVSMDCDNIMLLHTKPYRVSWKADGTRYMMLVQGDGEVFFVDRENSIFEVNGLKFPHVRETRNLRDTLMDGEMVIDKDRGKNIPRYLVYDVIMYDGQDVSKSPFYPDRYSIIEAKIIFGRQKAMQEARLIKEREPFSIRLKHFWDVTQSKNLLGEKFAKQLSHEPDGLIFQPAKEKYCTGTSKEVLKWKPLSLNSVDFKLKIVTESGMGILPRKIGHLYVGGLNTPYGTIKITKQIRDLDNAIVECKFENSQWVFMRQRIDKSYPNSIATADSVCKSINKPVTKERLLDYIERYRFARDDADLMPPPNKKPKQS